MQNETPIPLVSIIIPLFNAESYVDKAIECVLNQTYQNIEILVVNDGSTDNSLTVAKQFESNQVKIFDQSNKGASAARNFGFLKSKGQFIKFFDADDLMNLEMIEEQVKMALKHPNAIISAKWGRFFNNDISTFKIKNTETNHDLMPIDWICEAWKNAKPMHQCGIFLLPRQIIEIAGIWDESLSLNDDMEFFTKNILASQGVFFCKKGILYYRSGLGNSNLSSSTNIKAIESHFKSIDKSTNYLLEKKKDSYTLKLIADIWQKFVYDAYQFHKDLALIGEDKVIQYGGSELRIHGGRRLLIFTKLFGWKLALKIDYLIKTKIKL